MKHSLIALVGGLYVLAATASYGQEAATDVVQNLIAHATSASSADGPWTLEPTDYQQDLRQLPIGVFDSGIGGLTVLEAILSLDAHHNETAAPGPDGKPDFLGERFVYLGDQANMPYGNYAAVGKQDFLRELILKDVVFLLGKRYWPSSNASQPVFTKPPVKAIAIGCNTATAYGLEDIQAALKVWEIPIIVIGVVEAGARGVLENQQRQEAVEQPDQSVAVLATIGTCNSQAYPKAIGRALGLAGRRIPKIVQHGFADLAAAIEGDPKVLQDKSIDAMIRDDLEVLVRGYREEGNTQPIGSIVLGCTHFPLVEEKILAEFARWRQVQVDGQLPFQSLIAEEIRVVDPAELTAKELFRTLVKSRLRVEPAHGEPAHAGQHLYFISIPNGRREEVELAEDGGLTKEYKYGRQPMKLDLEDTLVVPMKPEQLPPASLRLIQTSLPHVWESLSDDSVGSP